MIKNLLPEDTFWITEDWYIAQTERWDRLSANWNFYIPPIKPFCIGIGMHNATHEAQFFILNTGSVEQRHTTLLLMCELYDAQSYPSENLNKINDKTIK